MAHDFSPDVRRPDVQRPDVRQLPFLVRLIDDDSPRVRERVAQQLRAFGDVELEIQAQNIVLTASQRAALNALGLRQKATALASSQAASFDGLLSDAPSKAPRSWLDWLGQRDENAKLEAALSYLARWQKETESLAEFSSEFFNEYSGEHLNLPPRNLDLLPHSYGRSKLELGSALDALTQEFRATGRPWHPESLSAWLFVEKGFRGNMRDYYNARNSNLLDVIQYGRGIPISLTCVFILVGARLGLDIRGCNFPGHFLAHARSGGMDLLFDCFDAGRLLSPFEINAIRKAEPLLLAARMPSEIIVERVLRNLTVAYQHSGELEKMQHIQGWLIELEHATEQ